MLIGEFELIFFDPLEFRMSCCCLMPQYPSIATIFFAALFAFIFFIFHVVSGGKAGTGISKVCPASL